MQLKIKVQSWDTVTDATEEDLTEEIEDTAALDLNLPEMTSMLNLNQKLKSTYTEFVRVLYLFEMGKIGYSNLSFYNKERYEKGFPSPFVMEQHFKVLQSSVVMMSEFIFSNAYLFQFQHQDYW